MAVQRCIRLAVQRARCAESLLNWLNFKPKLKPEQQIYQTAQTGQRELCVCVFFTHRLPRVLHCVIQEFVCADIDGTAQNSHQKTENTTDLKKISQCQIKYTHVLTQYGWDSQLKKYHLWPIW